MWAKNFIASRTDFQGFKPQTKFDQHARTQKVSFLWDRESVKGWTLPGKRTRKTSKPRDNRKKVIVNIRMEISEM